MRMLSMFWLLKIRLSICVTKLIKVSYIFGNIVPECDNAGHGNASGAGCVSAENIYRILMEDDRWTKLVRASDE
jgi:hypothetical protein